MKNLVFRCANRGDIKSIAEINSAVFLGDKDRLKGAEKWVNCWYKSYPLYQYFIAEYRKKVVGYAGWQVHGGFHRAEPVIELDQIGVKPNFQGNGIAPKLIDHSVDKLIDWMKITNDRIESHITFVVWAYALNFNAISVYANYFSEGIKGHRAQFGDRAESMLRVRLPLVRPVRK